MAIPTNQITVEQYLDSFEGYPGLRDELINGRIKMAPMPKPLHQQVRENTASLLDAACKGTEYTVNGNSNILFPTSNSAPSPDVFVVASASWEEAIKADKYVDVPPLLAVEVLSKSEDVSEKVGIYQEAGVTALWIVDPERHTVLVYSSLGENLNAYAQLLYTRPEMNPIDVVFDDPSIPAEKRILIKGLSPDIPEIPLPLPLHGSVSIDSIFAELP